MLPVVIYRFHG